MILRAHGAVWLVAKGLRETQGDQPCRDVMPLQLLCKPQRRCPAQAGLGQLGRTDAQVWLQRASGVGQS